MSVLEHNTQPISLREGKVFIDGGLALDSVNFTITVTPDTWSGKQLGEQTDSHRWLGYSIKGSITRRRSTNWLKNVITRFIRTGRTPEFTIQGLMNDRNSDFFLRHGSDLVTCLGCILTGDLPLTRLDSRGDVVDDVINFNAKKIV